MNKLFARFEMKINEKAGLFLLDHDTTIPEAKEMAFAFLKYLGQVEDAGKALEAKKNEEQKIEALEQPPQEVVNE